MLCRLGEIYTLCENYKDAMDCYNRALGLNPDLVAAQKMLERLEKLMRGSSSNDMGVDFIEENPSTDSTQSGSYQGHGRNGYDFGHHMSSYAFVHSPTAAS
jgi:tetratricopeptide (TPR) repeat protein